VEQRRWEEIDRQRNLKREETEARRKAELEFAEARWEVEKAEEAMLDVKFKKRDGKEKTT